VSDDGFAAAWERLSAAELLREMAAGRLPAPEYAERLGFTIRTVQPGRVECDWRPTPHLVNTAGSVHGGYLAMVLDNGGALACASLGEVFRPMLTLSLNLDFLRVVRAAGSYTVTGEVVHAGRTRIVAEAAITDADGRRMARASGSFTPNLTFDPTAAPRGT
jgi:uncharacterized protein (TIGR00369 family)